MSIICKIKKERLIRRTKTSTKKWKFWVVGCAEIVDGLVIVLSLGYLTSSIRAKVIFSTWAEDID